MKISDIQNLDMNALVFATKEELIQIVKDAAKVLNQKLNRLYRAGAETESTKIATYAYDYAMRTGGLFGTLKEGPAGNIEEMTRNELLQEAARENYFANLKTSNVREAKKEKKRREEGVLSNLSKSQIKRMTQTDLDKMVSDYWEGFNKKKETYKLLASDQILEVYAKFWSQGDEEVDKKLDELKAKIAKEIQEDIYEQAEEETGFSAPFLS